MVTAKPKTTKDTEKSKIPTGKPAAEKPANPVAEAQPDAVVAVTKVVKRKELVDRIAARSGRKPNVVKSVLDAVLQEIGDALSVGESLQVQPLGKISVNRRKELPDGEVMVCKLRRKNPVDAPAIATVDAAE